ncbi:DUF6415 family natural product biosynthesis protein [Streptomyces platensis]|uniref:DUF6415 family natural product biosynthesis protein n=1 Tax=Streptomyces platensis TaxID=58346 RepID=UPI00379139C6
MDTERAHPVGAAPAVVTEPDASAIDVATIRESVAEAHRLRGLAATDKELGELAQLLRGHIAELLPTIQATVDQLWHGSLEWSRKSGRLSGIRAQSEQKVGAGKLAAHVLINQLERDCQWLVAEYEARQT